MFEASNRQSVVEGQLVGQFTRVTFTATQGGSQLSRSPWRKSYPEEQHSAPPLIIFDRMATFAWPIRSLNGNMHTHKQIWKLCELLL
jgi:hypothetical protein